jgi:putative transposase
MSSRIDRELAMNALLMAVWRRQPKNTVMVHSDQGSQFSSYDWRDFLDAHNLQQSMSRRGNCHDNAVAESFFQLIKRERIRRKTYTTRAEAREDVFDYIEMFCNPKRRYGFNENLSPVNFEKRYFERLASVWQTRGDSYSSLTQAVTMRPLWLQRLETLRELAA